MEDTTTTNTMQKKQPVNEKAAAIFDSMKRDAEKAIAENDGEKTLSFAAFIVRTVLKKLYEKTGVDTFHRLRLEVEKDLSLYHATQNLSAIATKTVYNRNGERRQVIADSNANTVLKICEKSNYSDGMNLINTAYLALLEQAAEHGQGERWMDTTYKKSVLDKRVIIQKEDSAAFHEVDTTPIQEVFRAVRQAINDSAAVKSANNKYCYMEELTDSEKEKAYRRLPQYIDLGAADSNGIYTADRQTAEDYYTIIEKLNLSARQAQIVQLRMKGYGYKAIASYCGISVTSITRQIDRIREKAVAIGFIPAINE